MPRRSGPVLICSPYVVHLQPEAYRDPEWFDPRRWKDGPGTYIPFRAGARKCITTTGYQSGAVLVHNCNLYDCPGWRHVLEDHVPGSRGVIGDPDATLFHVPGGLRGTDYVDTVGDYIEETVDRGRRRANTPDAAGRRDGDVYEMEFDYRVGSRQDGTSPYNVLFPILAVPYVPHFRSEIGD